MFKKILCLFAAVIMAFSQNAATSAMTDFNIYTDPVENTFVGRAEVTAMISNLDFKDVSLLHWAREAIAADGALGLVEGDNGFFRPDEMMTAQEAIAFIVRMMGLEAEAHRAGAEQAALMPEGSPLKTLWSLGYLTIAADNGLITAEELVDALTPEQVFLDPEASFMREALVSREQVAQWLMMVLSVMDKEFAMPDTRQAVLSFYDYEDISADRIDAVEFVASNNIMAGDTTADGKRFFPKNTITRAEMAQILKNLDSVYLNSVGIEKKTGTVGGVSDSQINTTGSKSLRRSIYIRTETGAIDLIWFDTDSQSGTMDAIVYKNRSITGLYALEEGDTVEYLARTADQTVMYVRVIRSGVEKRVVTGTLDAVNVDNGLLTIKDSLGKQFSYPMVKGMYGTDESGAYVYFENNKKYKVSELPFGSRVSLELKNDIVDNIMYLGEPVLLAETRGIVTENNTDFGYLTIYNNEGKKESVFYYANDIRVLKREYYDMNGSVGYISQMFPGFEYNPYETTVDRIEAGDIVFINVDPLNPDYIAEISAAANYTAKYARVTGITPLGDVSYVTVEYEDKQVSYFDIANNIFVSKNGKPVGLSDLTVGDYVMLLINQAVIEPGYYIESVKELRIEGGAHYISNLLKGQLSGINAIQNQIQLKNAETLMKTGWGAYKELTSLTISKETEYYLNGNKITLDYAVRMLNRSDCEAYAAMENNYMGERVKKITFRTGRDELLSPETVVDAGGNGEFRIMSVNGSITTDEGTIVRRFGRLVDGNNIFAPDYAYVTLNGGNNAAVVDIIEYPGVDTVMIARGRVQSVDDGRSFRLQSMSVLTGNEYSYTPVSREFVIDYNTVFLNENGFVDRNTFIGYTENTVIDKVYNIVADGTRAAYVVDSPYATSIAKGVIYEINEDSVKLKNAEIYDNKTGKWMAVSNFDSTVVIHIPQNSLIAKNNAVTTARSLETGDTLRVFTDSLPDKVVSGTEINGYILLVDR